MMSSDHGPSASRERTSRVARRAKLALCAAAGPSLLCASVALADNYTWIAAPGLASFSTAGNWNPLGPPGPIDIPVFNSNQANTVSFDVDQTNIALEVLQGSITFQPDLGIAPTTRTYSLTIDSFIHGGSLTLAGISSPQREFRMNLAENLIVGGDTFSAGPASGLTLGSGASMHIGQGLKLWNSSTLTINGGSMHVGTFDHSSAGTFSFTAGRLHAGTFFGNLTNDGGTIAPGSSVGVTRITGNLQMNSGAVEIELGGFNPGQDNDQLQVSGSATLGTSTIVIRTLNDFLPLPGDVFEVITYASATGDPQVVNETGYAGLTFTKQLTATSLALRAQALFPGDADLDGQVDLVDLVALANHWQQLGTWLEGDFDGNGFVDANDLGLLALNWQAGVNAPSLPLPAQTLNAFADVPEPTTVWLLFLLPFLQERRRNAHVIQA